MAISDVILGAKDPKVWQILAEEMVRKSKDGALNIQFPHERNLKGKTPTQWLAEDMIKTESSRQARLKQLLKINPGLEGANHIIGLLPETLKLEIEGKLNSLESFKHGDLGSFAEHAAKEGAMDQVHIINALGFDPLGDEKQSIHLAKGIKPGGTLIITAEASGDSLSSLIPKREIDYRDASQVQNYLERQGQDALANLPIGQYFSLKASVVDTRDKVMKGNTYTERLTTRHTIGGKGAVMEDKIPTAQIVLVRNDKAIESVSSSAQKNDKTEEED